MTSERGSVKAWVLAFVITAGVGLGGLIGIGCLVDANVCPGSSPRQESTDGATLFIANCAACHGQRGEGGRGPSLVSGTPASYTVEELVSKISRGKPLAGMPAFKRGLTEEQIRAVAEYVISLRGAA